MTPDALKAIDENTEVEVRLGRVVGDSFVPAISPGLFDALRSSAARKAGHSEFSDQTDVLVPLSPAAAEEAGLGGRPQSLRIVLDTETQTPLEALVKRRSDPAPFITGPDGISLRFGNAAEIQLPRFVPATAPDTFDMSRRKMRHSFIVDEGVPVPFRLDLTQVTTKRGGGGGAAARGEVSYEAEIEYDTPALRELMRSPAVVADPTVARAEVKKMVAAMLAFLEAVMADARAAASDSHPTLGVHVDPVHDDEAEPLRKWAATLVSDCRSEAFPGPLPVPFSRRYMSTVQNAQYLVSEKTDGLRFLLLINAQGSYLVNRDFSFSFVPSDHFPTLFAGRGSTLLDGELVRNQTTRLVQFMVFDALQVNGVEVASRTLLKRLEAVRDGIIKPYREARDAGVFDEAREPFVIINKNFFTVSQLPDKVRAHITRGTEARHWIWRDDKRHHRTDGLIFTPVEEPYLLRPTLPLLKWKYPELLSVDAALRYYRGRWMFAVAADGANEEVHVLDVQLEGGDATLMEEEMKLHPRGGAGMIVELSFESWSGTWRYLGRRHDKVRPNHVRTFASTLEAAAECVTLDELVYRLPIKPEADRYRQLFEGSGKKAVRDAMEARNRAKHLKRPRE
jgi:hypothetical protein